MFFVEFTTTAGKVSESYATYEEAVRRIEEFPAESLVGMPLLFQDLPDGSQRVVRPDGKPLQWHRQPHDEFPAPEEPLPLAEPPPTSPAEGPAIVAFVRESTPWGDEEDEPLPLSDATDLPPQEE